MGPDTYDLVSLLRDSYVDLPEPRGRRAHRVLPCAQRPHGRPGRVPPALRPHGAAAQSEGAGHVRLPGDDRAPNPVYIQYIPRTLRYARENAASKYAALRAAARVCWPLARRGVPLTAMRVRPLDAPVSRRAAQPPASRDDRARTASTAIEVFATRTHVDYHDPRARRRTARLARRARPDARQHARADLRRLHATACGAAPTRTRRADAAAPAARPSPRRAPRSIAARRLGCDVVVLHLGLPDDAARSRRRQRPRRRAPQPRAPRRRRGRRRRPARARGHSERPVARRTRCSTCSTDLELATPASVSTSATRT